MNATPDPQTRAGATPAPPAPPPARASFRLTREGGYWLLAAAVLWLIGMYKGINLLSLVASFMLIFWAFNAVAARRAVRPLRLRRWLDGPLFARTPFTLEVEVYNPTPRPRVGVSLQDRGPDHSLVRFVTRLDGGRQARFRQEVTLPRRGWYAWEPLQATSGYPFGLAEAAVAAEPAEKAVVFPELGRLHRGRLRHFLSRAAPSLERVRNSPCRHPAAQNEFHGLRAFRTGDSPRLIHWRTSARRGELMVREFEETPTDNLILVLDPWLPPGGGTDGTGTEGQPAGAAPGRPAPPPPPAALEDALSLAATVCWEWCRQKGDRFVLAVAGPAPVILEGVTGRDHALLMLECLALVPGSPAPDLDGLVERLTATALPEAPVLAVSSRPGGAGDFLAGRLHRRVTSLDLSAGQAYDFFERGSPRAP